MRDLSRRKLEDSILEVSLLCFAWISASVIAVRRSHIELGVGSRTIGEKSDGLDSSGELLPET